MKTIRTEQLSLILGHLYDAILDLNELNIFTEQLALALNAKSSMLRFVRPDSMDVLFNASYNFDPLFNKKYAEYFVHVDPVLQQLKQVPTNYITTSTDILDYSDFIDTEYFNDYLIPQDNYYLVGGLISNNPNLFVFLGVQRTKKQRAFSSHDIKFLQDLVPHINRTTAILSEIKSLDAYANTLESVFVKKLNYISIDINANVIYCNKPAEDFMTEDSRLFVRHGKLRFLNKSDQDRYDYLIKEAVLNLHKNKVFSLAFMLSKHCQRSTLDDHYIVVTNNEHILDMNQARISIIIGTISLSQKINQNVLISLYGLTKRESMLVCSLADNTVLSNYCEKEGISLNTGRTQLKSVFRKMNVNSQASMLSKVFQIFC